MQTKDERMRFETSLRNKDGELTRLQLQLDKEKESFNVYSQSRDREERELRKQINHENEKHISAAREAERNMTKYLNLEEKLASLKKTIDFKDETIQNKDKEIERLKIRHIGTLSANF
jgi:chromosome segregation ATPase